MLFCLKTTKLKLKAISSIKMKKFSWRGKFKGEYPIELSTNSVGTRY